MSRNYQAHSGNYKTINGLSNLTSLDQLPQSLVPSQDLVYKVGLPNLRWQTGNFGALIANEGQSNFKSVQVVDADQTPTPKSVTINGGNVSIENNVAIGNNLYTNNLRSNPTGSGGTVVCHDNFTVLGTFNSAATGVFGDLSDTLTGDLVTDPLDYDGGMADSNLQPPGERVLSASTINATQWISTPFLTLMGLAKTDRLRVTSTKVPTSKTDYTDCALVNDGGTILRGKTYVDADLQPNTLSVGTASDGANYQNLNATSNCVRSAIEPSTTNHQGTLALVDNSTTTGSNGGKGGSLVFAGPYKDYGTDYVGASARIHAPTNTGAYGGSMIIQTAGTDGLIKNALTVDTTQIATFHGDTKIEGSKTLEFGKGVVKNQYAGQIGYGVFGEAQKLSIVGGGLNPTNRTVKIFDILETQNVVSQTMAISSTVDASGTVNIISDGVVEFGKNVVGKEENAGKIAYKRFSGEGLDIVGAGELSGERRVIIYDKLDTGSISCQNLDTSGATVSFKRSGADAQIDVASTTNHPSKIRLISNNVVKNIVTTTTSNKLEIFSGTANKNSVVVDNATGYVGINGMNAPVYPLDVNGQARFSDTVFVAPATGNSTLAINSTNAQAQISFGPNGNLRQTFVSKTGGQFGIFNYPSVVIPGYQNERLSINSSGLVGINNTDPQTELDVNGTVKCTQLDVANTITFNQDIKLKNAKFLELGSDASGKETNAGKISYNGFSTGSVEIIGAGTSAGARKVTIFDRLNSVIGRQLGTSSDWTGNAQMGVKLVVSENTSQTLSPLIFMPNTITTRNGFETGTYEDITCTASGLINYDDWNPPIGSMWTCYWHVQSVAANTVKIAANTGITMSPNNPVLAQNGAERVWQIVCRRSGSSSIEMFLL